MKGKVNNPRGRTLGIEPVVTWGFAFKPDDRADEDLFDLPIPLGRPDLSGSGHPSWTYRSYFQAVERELSRDGFAIIKEILRRKKGRRTRPEAVKALRIIAEKHGNFYHPARVEVLAGEETFRFVLNAALTDWGRVLLPQEVRTLTHLERKYPYPYLPRVYNAPVTPLFPSPPAPDPKGALVYFLAEWFDGFHEFHWSLAPQKGQRRLRLWDGGQGARFLTKVEEEKVFAQGTKILTCYYDPRTYEQIYPWHHGAGDFVARIEGQKVEVRLISARKYGPLIEPGEADPVEALFFFFLNLSLRMRLDRLDGTGETIWADDHSLTATWQGFLEALETKVEAGEITSSFLKGFLKEGARLSLKELEERFSQLLDSYDPQAPDLPVIRENLRAHVQGVRGLFLKGKADKI